MKIQTAFSSFRLTQMNSSFDSESLSEDYSDLLEPYYNASVLDVSNEILANPDISDSEKAILEKLVISLLDDELSVNTFEVQKMNDMIDQLLANCDENHPYAYYYHYLKGVVVGFSEKDPELAIQHFDESVRLNPEFQYAYGFRAIIHLMENDYAAGIKDLITVAHMNKTYIAELIEKLIKDLSVQV